MTLGGTGDVGNEASKRSSTEAAHQIAKPYIYIVLTARGLQAVHFVIAIFGR